MMVDKLCAALYNKTVTEIIYVRAAHSGSSAMIS